MPLGGAARRPATAPLESCWLGLQLVAVYALPAAIEILLTKRNCLCLAVTLVERRILFAGPIR